MEDRKSPKQRPVNAQVNNNNKKLQDPKTIAALIYICFASILLDVCGKLDALKLFWTRDTGAEDKEH